MRLRPSCQWQGVESVPPARAKEMIDSGNWVLVDIRPDNKYQAAHPRGAKNVQLYKKASCTMRSCQELPIHHTHRVACGSPK